MKNYEVIISDNARRQIREYVSYILFHLKSRQSAKAVYDDFIATKDTLKSMAGTFRICDNSKLAARGLRKIHLEKHNYVMLYHIEENVAYVDFVFHDSQDYENEIY